VATLTQVTGEVLVLHGQDWVRVDQVPVSLSNGDTVSTDRGRAEVHFLRDDSVLVLDVGTHLTISETEQGGAGKFFRRIQIFLGDVWFQMQHSLNRKTDLVTPTAVGGLRGTEGLIHVSDQDKTEFTLSEGRLQITPGSSAGGPDAETPGKDIILNAGETAQADRGQPLQAHKASALPKRPEVNVAANQLPKPSENWRDKLPVQQRPPSASEVPPISSHPTASRAAGAKEKPLKTKPPKNHKPATKPHRW
jgi:hypothetical protein